MVWCRRKPLSHVCMFSRLWLGYVTILCAAMTLGAAKTHAADDHSTVASLLENRCFDCHSSGVDSEAGLDLTGFSADAQSADEAAIIRKLINVIDLGEMPPAMVEPLENSVRQQTVETLRASLFKAIAAGHIEPASTPIRRMNRFQYNNAVQDLFQLKPVVFTLPERMLRDHGGYFQPATGQMPETVRVGSRPLGKSQLIEPRLAGVGAFPQDLRAENGFDNRADHLSLSPLLMESFLQLGRSIVDSPDFNPKTAGIWKEFFAPPSSEDVIESAVRERLTTFLTRAFRRPVDAATHERYSTVALQLIDNGTSFTDAMKHVAAAAVASPRFLYLYDAPQSVDKSSTQYDLATRLSFLLWGSLPDDELLKLAGEGSLSDRQTLSEQVDRLLNDRRLKRFCDSFPTQWLQLDRIVSAVPDRAEFPDFYFAKYRSSMHMMLEPLLVFETVLIENRPITELIDSEFSYRSGRLSHLYYGKPQEGKKGGSEVTVIPFHRVSLDDRREGGCITTAAVMAMTSGTHETKPITRGAWLTTVVFNNPPEPPPADVPPLPEKPQVGEENLTLRERLVTHRERADCAGCHERIDPLGFALENFGPTGKWREKYHNGRDVDMAGTLFRRYPFQNVVEFKDAILVEKVRFTRAFASHLLSFALARELTVADEPAVDQIVRNTAADGYRMRTLIREVVLSEPFANPGNGDHPQAQRPHETAVTR